nr:hypothetical protein [Prevotella sp.]
MRKYCSEECQAEAKRLRKMPARASSVKRQKQKSQHKTRNQQKGKRRKRCLTIIQAIVTRVR